MGLPIWAGHPAGLALSSRFRRRRKEPAHAFGSPPDRPLAALGLAFSTAAFAAEVKTDGAKKKPAPAQAARQKAGDGSVNPGDTRAHKPFTPADAKPAAPKAPN